ncbi:MAG: chemotaxis protein CheX [Acidobacteriota bacterium]
MRLDFVKIFISSTKELLYELLGSDVDVASIDMQATPVTGSEVITIIGLAGEAHGRVIFDMDLNTSMKLGAHLIGEEPKEMDSMVSSSIAELSSMAIGRAISQINNNGTRLKMTPPLVIKGTNLESFDRCYETLVAPIQTPYGEVRMNVTIHDLD